ncbi:hypothetical protein FLJC2902T_13600 [Flavobacterium limnosediminis JC2902]|uniref:Uncharacterized protein n=1 Tax=Flavobacterium limnosediminis JC2902 TaxID=1341181 RepID=V6SQP1_9FLAO|nr:hypothetical protein FLJC2902T_13600 [Flavobacterium limnosediminis JC2902]
MKQKPVNRMIYRLFAFYNLSDYSLNRIREGTNSVTRKLIQKR